MRIEPRPRPTTALARSFAIFGLGLISTLADPAAAGFGSRDWPEYLGGPDRNHYSPLSQIGAGNVARLRKAWEFHTGDFGVMECNPIVVDRVLFGVTAQDGVFALDADTGRERWRIYALPQKIGRGIRGVTYWAEGSDRRIFFTAGQWLWAVNAANGLLLKTFGDAGKVDLRAALGPAAQNKELYSTTPGTLVGDLLIMPTTMTESADAAPGFIQAFDVHTGKLAWIFRTIPAPGEKGYETWSPNSYRNIDVGSANCWAGMAVDRARGILYVPTGSAAPDFWGGHRKGANLFANCLLALDAATGKLLWHFQAVHHDLWDRDLPAPPNLITVTHNGRKVDAVAQVTKAGVVFVFDRVTGEPLFPIHETAVPKSDVPGEDAFPTQPIPSAPPPFARQTLTESDIGPFARNRAALVERFRQAHFQLYQPFGKYETVLFPGFEGGAEWGGAAVDPGGVMYINANEMAWIGTLIDTPGGEALAHLPPGQSLYLRNCAACHGTDRTGNPLSGFPSLIKISERRTPEAIVQIIANGAGRMPGFPILTGAEKRTLADFILGLERKTPAGDTNGAPSVPAGVPVPSGNPEPFTLKGYEKFLDADGYPANSPPWGTLTAIDLNSGRQIWRITLGEYPELTARGIPPTGTENFGGPMVTASGLVFIGATLDCKFRAFDSGTGRLLWETDLPAGGQATPSTYEVDGKQYVVVGCGGSRVPGQKGDSYVAFALP